MFLEFIIFISGFMFASRMREEFIERQNLVASTLMTKIGTAYFCIIAFAILFLRSSLQLWLIVFVPQLTFFIFIVCLKNQRRSGFQEKFANILTRLILKMKAGRGFRQALGEIILEVDPQMRIRLSEVRDLVVFSQHDATETAISPSLAPIISEFRLADQLPHAALRRLQVFREKIRCENEFRRKSGQILKQIRAQSLLLSGLYVAVLIFVARHFDALKHARLIFCSISLFCAGLFWIWWGGRRWKWKV